MNLTSFPDSPSLLDWPQVEAYIERAAEAFEVYRTYPVSRRIDFLGQIAMEIAAIRAELVDVCYFETHLPHGRLQGEIDRTINQINLFVTLLADGSWVNAIIDTANPQRTPSPKPGIRQMQVPIGPVCVFGASNFPFAFSVAGADTISALAAGCPVLYKVHMAHPETSLMVSNCIEKARRSTGMPEGVFASLMVASREVASKMVAHDAVKALAFTGSFSGGKALYDVAVKRKTPIPVYAEMGSVNPVFLLPDRLKHHAESTATALVTSNTLGAGQFCTNPGLVFLVRSTETERFLALYGGLLAKQTSQVMLTPGICDAYTVGVERLKRQKGMTLVVEGENSGEADSAIPMAFRVSGKDFHGNEVLKAECFGPALIFVIVDDIDELTKIAVTLEGQLTASVWCMEDEIDTFTPLFRALEQKVGRLIVNGAPTGVEVCHAMVHGGPFPATTDARSTSVGTQAIYRFTRPLCYQNYPDSFLPPELQNGNPLGIWRKVDGEWTNNPLI